MMPKIKINNGTEVFYKSYGHGDPIVFVTGFSGDHTLYEVIAKESAAKGYNAIIFDNRGCGQTDSPDYPYTAEMMADDAAGLIDALQLKSAHWVGCSFGGCIVQTILQKYPAITKSAVLANTTRLPNMRLRLYAKARLELIQAGAPESSVVKLITLLCWSNNYLSRPGRLERLLEAGFFPITESGYVNQLNALLNFNSKDWFENVKTPCLIIGCDDDLLVSAQESEELAQANPSAQYYCFKGVGHMPILEDPLKFNDLVFGFLKKQEKNAV